VDPQSVKTTGVGGQERGFDPAKRRWKAASAICSSTPRVWCSKPRYTDSARIPDADGIRVLLLESARVGLWRLWHLWVDAGYPRGGAGFGRLRLWA